MDRANVLWRLALCGLLLAGCAGDRKPEAVRMLGEPLRQGPREVVTDPLLNGVWMMKTAELGGKPFSFAPDFELRIGGNRYGVGLAGNYYDRGRIELFGDELAGQPRRLDTVGEVGPNKAKRISALYRLVGRDLEIIYDLSGANRPVDFVSRPDSQLLRVLYTKKPQQ
ncbi:MAG: hypothetical protein ING75_01495 [Rhodocyclaceae bacterium]|nr:hypothetical protein [Rhodocyclaceae bacterium]